MSVRIRMFRKRTAPFKNETDQQFAFRMAHMEIGCKHPTRKDMVCVEYEMKTHSKSQYVLTSVYKYRPGLKFIEGYCIVPKGTSLVAWTESLVKKAVQK